MWVRSLGQADPLEKDMATNSSILACKILWTEEHTHTHTHSEIPGLKTSRIRHISLGLLIH